MLEERVSNYFLTIAQELNISRAAEKLFISQPSLSKFLGELEKRLSVKLFLRNKNTLKLTPAGMIFLQYVKADNKLRREYITKMHVLVQESMKKIVVGCGSTSNRYLAQIVFPKFKMAYPNIELEVKEELHVDLLKLLKQKKIDLAMVVASKADVLPTGYYEEILCQPRLLVVSEEHPLGKMLKNPKQNNLFHPQKINPQDLKNYTLISGTKGQEIYYDMLNFKKKYKLTGLQFVSSQSVEAGIALAACNMGIYVVPAFNLLTRPKLDKFYYFTIDDELMYWRQIFRYPTNNPPEIVKAFTAIAKKELRKFGKRE